MVFAFKLRSYMLYILTYGSYMLYRNVNKLLRCSMQHRFKGKMISIVGKKNAEVLKKDFYFYSKKKNVNAAVNDLIPEKMLDVIFGKTNAINIRNNDMNETKCEVDIHCGENDDKKYITFEVSYEDSWEEAAS